jgi:diadenosine tetraphosphatase ApaH/serine/threonine PP2A family protein phosphatase
VHIAVVSDIHGNLPALEAVLAAIDREGVDELWCLGDLVGYGARPNECCAAIRTRAATSLCGNHDLAVLGTLDLTEFAGDAAVAARWTRGVLADDERAWLAGLSPTARRDGADLFHGSPRDPVWEYVLSEHVALQSLLATTAPVLLVGHSHVPLGISWDGSDVEGGVAPAGTELAVAGKRWLLNPGSVGQPRDGDRRAAWLSLELPEGRARFRREDYDVERAQREIVEAGLPVALAARLEAGI